MQTHRFAEFEKGFYQWWENQNLDSSSSPKSDGFGFRLDLNIFNAVDLNLSFLKAVDLDPNPDSPFEV